MCYVIGVGTITGEIKIMGAPEESCTAQNGCHFLPENFGKAVMSIRAKRQKEMQKDPARALIHNLDHIKYKILEACKTRKQKSSEEALEKTCVQNEIEEASGSIATVRKDNVFAEDVTANDMDIIAKRVALQQKQFQEHQERREKKLLQNIINVFEFLTEKEARYALTECENDDESVIMKLSDSAQNYIGTIRRQIALDATPKEIDMAERSKAYQSLQKKREKYRSKTLSSKEKEGAKTYVRKRLRLKDALAQLKAGKDIGEAMEGWSPARIRAYKLIDTNPNAYYYRFNAPGEDQANGGWSEYEHELFMKRLEEVGANGQWGIFSQSIPGRVGYQCSNYYRQLIAKGKIDDPNYYMDDKGKVHYLFGKKQKDGTTTQEIRTFTRTGSAAQARKGKATKRKKRSKYDSDTEDDSDDDFGMEDSWKPSAKFFTTKRSRLLQGDLNEEDKAETPNPLPGFIDPITLDEVVMPAISPTGHVMSYSSWLQCLEQSKVCPLTKKPLSKRELVILTPDNIDRYEHLIVKP
eukprot:Nk52_evm15s276 gene=Nk52_evmTU15s276